jgi:hypothetical protein
MTPRGALFSALCIFNVLWGTLSACPESSTTCVADGVEEGDTSILLQTPALISKQESNMKTYSVKPNACDKCMAALTHKHKERFLKACEQKHGSGDATAACVDDAEKHACQCSDASLLEETDHSDNLGDGDHSACDKCNAALTHQQKERFFNACEELHGSGDATKEDRDACVGDAEKHACQADCSDASLLEERDDSDNLGDDDHSACDKCMATLTHKHKERFLKACEDLHGSGDATAKARNACVGDAEKRACHC